MKSIIKDVKDIYFDFQSFHSKNKDIENDGQTLDKECMTNVSFSIENLTKISYSDKILEHNYCSNDSFSESFIIMKENKKGLTSFQTPFDYDNHYDEEISSCVINIKNFQKEIEEMIGKNNNIIPNCQSQNKYLKEEKYRRKYSTDSLHKKIKRFFFLYMRSYCTEIFNLTIPKIPNYVITNVTIRFNKYVFNIHIKDFFSEFCKLSFSSNEKEGNFDSKQELLLKCKIKDFYSLYLNNQFDKDLNEIKKKESLLYHQSFKERGLDLIQYFSKLEPFKKRINKLIE